MSCFDRAASLQLTVTGLGPCVCGQNISIHRPTPGKQPLRSKCTSPERILSTSTITTRKQQGAKLYHLSLRRTMCRRVASAIARCGPHAAVPCCLREVLPCMWTEQLQTFACLICAAVSVKQEWLPFCNSWADFACRSSSHPDVADMPGRRGRQQTCMQTHSMWQVAHTECSEGG